MNPSTLRFTRAAALLRSAWGGTLLLRGRAVLNSFGDRPTSGSLVVARILGGRQIVQGVVTAALPEPAVLAGGAAVDVLHSATAVGLAVASRRWRTVAVTDAVVAATLAGTGCWLAYRALRRPPS